MYNPQNQDFLVRPDGNTEEQKNPKSYKVLRFFNTWRYENTQTPEQLQEYLVGCGLEFIHPWGQLEAPTGYYRIRGN